MALYIHIPFCKSRCIYCDFYSTTYGQDLMASYVQALEREMSFRGLYKNSSRTHTLYIGGGTPSLLPPDILLGLFDAVGRHCTIEAGAEVTIEANPDDITQKWLNALSDTPVNRISMGAQTFNDDILRFLRRRHNAQQTVDAVRACRTAGITNISIDLIYGLPHQTFEDWQHDVEQALSLGITHLSAYALSVEPGTPLQKMMESSPLWEDMEETEELSRKMYDYLLAETGKAGFVHYEISNFSLPGFHSRHNSVYWQGTPYIGLGAGAHSYDGQCIRRANLPDIKTYIASRGDVPHEIEELSDEALYNEFIMTRLRTSCGIPLDMLSEENRRYCLSMANPHIERHLLHIKNEHLCLTKEGIFTSNDIITDLMK